MSPAEPFWLPATATPSGVASRNKTPSRCTREIICISLLFSGQYATASSPALLNLDGPGHAEREMHRAVVRERARLREGVLVRRPHVRQWRIVTARVRRGA